MVTQTVATTGLIITRTVRNVTIEEGFTVERATEAEMGALELCSRAKSLRGDEGGGGPERTPGAGAERIDPSITILK